MNVKQLLNDAGLNIFGAQLLAESLLRHPDARKIEFTLPMLRADCPGWSGVKFILEPVPNKNNPLIPPRMQTMIDDEEGHP